MLLVETCIVRATCIERTKTRTRVRRCGQGAAIRVCRCWAHVMYEAREHDSGLLGVWCVERQAVRGRRGAVLDLCTDFVTH